MFGCASAKAQENKTHTVKAGETIDQIASKYNVSVAQILALNPKAKKKISSTMVLVIPKSKLEATSPETRQIKTLDGYITHKVKRNETLYSLSKKYNISQEEIKKNNPELYKSNIRKGNKLKIPNYIITTEVVAPELTKTHTVKPKEGKWRIAYQYGITVQELEKLNPNMAPVLTPGDVINVPNLEQEAVKTVDDKEFSYYTVLKSEGYYRLKINTGLDQAELEKLNPELLVTGLKEGMVLKIPFNEAIDAQNQGLDVNGQVLVTDLSVKEINKDVKRLAIMLPFKLNKINTDSIIDAKHTIKNDKYTSISLDFYSGAKMALDSLKKLGVNLKVDVYDTENRGSKVLSLLKENDLKDADVVIGPIMPKHFNTVASALRSKKVPLVSPITKKVNKGSNVFQSRPSALLLQQKVINHFKADTTSHVIIVSDSKNKNTSDLLKKSFKEASVLQSRKVTKTGEDAYYVLDDDIVEVLKKGKNIVFLETKNPGFVSNVSSIINSKINDTTQVVLATTKKNKGFESGEVRNTHLSNLNFTFSSINKSFSEGDTNSFTARYKKKYNVTPNSYAVRGFDLTMDVVLRILTSKDLYASTAEAPLTSYVENKFGYKPDPLGGYYNDTFYLVRYNNLKIEEVK